MTAALYVVHYGKEYLAYSVRSVQAAVDEVFVFYTQTPSFGFSSPLPCPDTEAELFAEANRFATKPVVWERGSWGNEWQHRDHALEVIKSRGHDMVLVVDADEIWDASSAQTAIAYAHRADYVGRWTARFANFWRSWDWMVHDHFRPIRVVDLRNPIDLTATLPAEAQPEPVFHFGYAQRIDLMKYKWTCHGHQAELRPGWMDKFLFWQPDDEDLHPVVNKLWDYAHATPANVRAKINELLEGHPYANVALIE